MDDTAGGAVARPVISVVDAGGDLAETLRRRFGADYEVLSAAHTGSALSHLEALDDDARVALVMAPLRLDGTSGLEHLEDVHRLAPDAMRILTIDVGDVAARGVLRQALTLHHLDFFCGSAWASPEEELYPIVSEALRLWAREHEPRFDKAVIVDHDLFGRGGRVHTMLERNGVWTRLVTADSDDGRGVLAEHGVDGGALPLLVLWDGRVLEDPVDTEIAEALGANTHVGEADYDLTVVGGGPAGLAAAAYAASEGLRVLCIEGTAIGGQAGTTSRIRNYLGFRWGISGSEFAERAGHQAEELGADYVVMRTATALRAEGEKRVVTLDDDEHVVSRAVVVACGVAYRHLGIPSVDERIGRGVFYGASVAEARTMSGRRVHVLGGGNSAGQIATYLAGVGADVTILVRSEGLGPPMTDYLVQEVEATEGLRVRSRTNVVGAGGGRRLEHLVLRDADTGEDEVVPSDALFVFIGASPHTDWLADAVALDERGFVLTGRDAGERWPLERHPHVLETSLPGVFAAGDVRHRSVKRVAAAVGEGSTATLLVREYLDGLGG